MTAGDARGETSDKFIETRPAVNDRHKNLGTALGRRSGAGSVLTMYATLVLRSVELTGTRCLQHFSENSINPSLATWFFGDTRDFLKLLRLTVANGLFNGFRN